MKGTEEEQDRAKEEAQVARLATVAAGDAKEHAEEARGKAVVETALLEVERTSLMLEIRATKDESTPFSPRPTRIRRPWRRTIRSPWR